MRSRIASRSRTSSGCSPRPDAARQAHAERFHHGVHGIGGTHACAYTRTADRVVGHAFQVFEAERARHVVTGAKEHFLDVHVMPAILPRALVAAEHRDRWNVGARGGHEMARRILSHDDRKTMPSSCAPSTCTSMSVMRSRLGSKNVPARPALVMKSLTAPSNFSPRRKRLGRNGASSEVVPGLRRACVEPAGAGIAMRAGRRRRVVGSA